MNVDFGRFHAAPSNTSPMLKRTDSVKSYSSLLLSTSPSPGHTTPPSSMPSSSVAPSSMPPSSMLASSVTTKSMLPMFNTRDIPDMVLLRSPSLTPAVQFRGDSDESTSSDDNVQFPTVVPLGKPLKDLVGLNAADRQLPKRSEPSKRSYVVTHHGNNTQQSTSYPIGEIKRDRDEDRRPSVQLYTKPSILPSLLSTTASSVSPVMTTEDGKSHAGIPRTEVLSFVSNISSQSHPPNQSILPNRSLLLSQVPLPNPAQKLNGNEVRKEMIGIPSSNIALTRSHPMPVEQAAGKSTSNLSSPPSPEASVPEGNIGNDQLVTENRTASREGHRASRMPLTENMSYISHEAPFRDEQRAQLREQHSQKPFSQDEPGLRQQLVYSGPMSSGPMQAYSPVQTHGHAISYTSEDYGQKRAISPVISQKHYQQTQAFTQSQNGYNFNQGQRASRHLQNPLHFPSRAKYTQAPMTGRSSSSKTHVGHFSSNSPLTHQAQENQTRPTKIYSGTSTDNIIGPFNNGLLNRSPSTSVSLHSGQSSQGQFSLQSLNPLHQREISSKIPPWAPAAKSNHTSLNIQAVSKQLETKQLESNQRQSQSQSHGRPSLLSTGSHSTRPRSYHTGQLYGSNNTRFSDPKVITGKRSERSLKPPPNSCCCV